MEYIQKTWQTGEKITADDLNNIENGIAVLSDEFANVQGGTAGKDGGYYTPSVTQPDVNTMRVSYTPSDSGMPAVQPVDVTLPAGAPGATPQRGVDYWTAADQQSIVSDVLAALPTWEGGSY